MQHCFPKSFWIQFEKLHSPSSLQRRQAVIVPLAVKIFVLKLHFFIHHQPCAVMGGGKSHWPKTSHDAEAIQFEGPRRWPKVRRSRISKGWLEVPPIAVKQMLTCQALAKINDCTLPGFGGPGVLLNHSLDNLCLSMPACTHIISSEQYPR
jgi:hypothetical protein